MNPANASSSFTNNSFIPIARIYAQEESFVIPLREYLETNGCRVLVNESPREHVTYHIVVGDFDFVKQIFAAGRNAGMRTLGIVVGSSVSDAKNLTGENKKIIVVDPMQLTREDVVEMFSYFFSGNDEVLNKKRNRHVPSEISNQKSVIREEKTEKKEQENRQRIDTIIDDVFGPGKKSRKKKKGIRGIVRQIFVVIVFFCLPLFWYLVTTTITGVSFGIAASRLQKGDTTNAARATQVGEYWLSQSSSSFRVIRFPLVVLGRTSAVRNQERLLSFFHNIRTSFEEAEDVSLMAKDVARMIVGSGTETGGMPAGTLERLKLSTTDLSNSLGLAQAELREMLTQRAFPFSFRPVQRKGEETLASLTDIRKALSYGESLLLLYPRLAGFDGPKRYLVLLQNSNELRPTGGFIGSIGKLLFDEGKMRDFTIQDVYAVDGQLKGHIDPPGPIRDLLNQEHWYLRDSNWDPDFTQSGARAAWFYQKETGESVDGVLGLSLPLIVDILRVTGPVMLSDYNDQITADNFFGKSMYYTKNNFFPGSTAKADFLGTLARTLVLRLTTDKSINPVRLFSAVTNGIARRDIQFFFTDSELQKLTEHVGWAGKIERDEGCRGVDAKRCMFAPFVVNEANLSVSKVNAFVNHTNHREIVIASDGMTTETSTITITNTASDNEPGIGGPYRTYIRLFVPTDATIQDVTLDGMPIPKRNEAGTLPSLPYAERVEAPERFQGLGVALEVAPGTNRRLRISYTRGMKLPTTGGESTFDVWQYKQPGLSGVEQSITIYYPVVWKVAPEGETNPAVAKDGEVSYNTSLLRDLFLRLRFTR